MPTKIDSSISSAPLVPGPRDATISFAEESVLPASVEDRWLERFHAGDRVSLAECYRDHFGAVERAVAGVVSGADRETIVHEVFFQLIARRELRENFRGGSLRAWLTTVARHQAIDYLRRHRRERELLEQMAPEAVLCSDAEPVDRQAEQRRVIEALAREVPDKWRSVFEARFLRQLSQRDAARELGLSRTTLAYQELRIRRLLTRFARRQEA